MSEATINLLLQIPLAGVVVMVVWVFLRYLERQDIRSQEFIKSQQELHADSIGRLAENIKDLATVTAELKGAQIAHNATFEAAMAAMNSKVAEKR